MRIGKAESRQGFFIAAVVAQRLADTGAPGMPLVQRANPFCGMGVATVVDVAGQIQIVLVNRSDLIGLVPDYLPPAARFGLLGAAAVGQQCHRNGKQGQAVGGA